MIKLPVRYFVRLIGVLLTLTVAARGEVVSLPADGLRLDLDDHGAVVALHVGRRAFESGHTPAGLFVRDGVGGDLAPAGLGNDQNRVTEFSKAALRMSARVEIRSEHLLVTGVVEDTRRTHDRSVDVVFCLPFKPAVLFRKRNHRWNAPASEMPRQVPISLYVICFQNLISSNAISSSLTLCQILLSNSSRSTGICQWRVEGVFGSGALPSGMSLSRLPSLRR